MSGVVSTTAARAHTPSTSPATAGDVADTGHGDGDRFRELLSRLSGVVGSDGKPEAAATDEGEATQDRPATPAWNREQRFAHAGRNLPDRGADAAAQRSVLEDFLQRQAGTTDVLQIPSADTTANAATQTSDGERSETLPDVLADILRAEDGTTAPPVVTDQTQGAMVAGQSAVTGIQAAVASAASDNMKTAATTDQALGTHSGPPGPVQRTAPVAQQDEADTLRHGVTRAFAEATALNGNAATETESVTAAGKTDVTILRRETHFAPIPQPSPMLQITGHIKAELDQLPALAPALGAPGLTFAQPSSEPVLKVLHIRLEPEELGTVTVRMSLKDDALELKLEVEKQTAAHAIQKDHEVLSSALRSAGYLVDGITVQVVAPDKAQIGTNAHGAQASLQSSAQSAFGEPQAHDGSGQGQSRGQDQPASRRLIGEPGQGAAGRAPGGGGVYL